MSFRTAVTGVNAATADLSVIANNIANSNTNGFKSSRTDFADVFYNAKGVGGGVQVAGLTQQFGQGNITGTANPFDLAIDGDGFFRVADATGILYTRAGGFRIDREGFVVNNLGQQLTGYMATNGELGRDQQPLKISTAEIPPRTTSRVEMGLNLNASATPIDPALTPFDRSNPNTYNFQTSLAVYDSLGTPHTVTAYFIKDAATNLWNMRMSVDGTASTNVVLSTPTLQFNSSGVLDLTATPQPLTATIDLAQVATDNGLSTGATTPLVFTIDFRNTTQFGSASSTNTLVQDGYSSAGLVNVDISEEGVIRGRYAGGQSLVIGQVTLARFANLQGLQPVGNSSWRETFESGTPVLGEPTSPNLGRLRSASLENSNVELTDELVSMISAQRNFQANTKMITATDEVTQAIMNAVR